MSISKLCNSTNESRELCRQIYLQVYSISQRLNDQQEQQEKKAQEEFRRSVIQWLAPYDPTTSYKNALAVHQAGTGQWFLGSSFHKWTTGENPPVLWLRGKPGVGKTTILSAAVNQIELQAIDMQNTVTAYFFCSFTDLSSQDPVNVFGWFVAQICNQNPSLWSTIDARYDGEMKKGLGTPKRLTLDELETLLKDICMTSPATRLFLDAPNESKQSSLMIYKLLRLALEIETVQIMISSTEEVKSPKILPSGRPLLFTVTMDSKITENDIENYVIHSLHKHERLRNLPSMLKQKIKSKLIRKADGMFRWVQCQIESLISQKTPLAIEAALERVPGTLEQTYSNILARIPPEDRKLAKEVFFWLSFSLRALSYRELCEAVIVEDDSTIINDNIRLLQDVDLLEICSSLISYDSDKQHIVLAHSSVFTYLTSEKIRDSDTREFFLDESSADTILTCKCLKYLCSPAFSTGYCDAEELHDRWRDWPLLEYCAESWPTHARYAEDSSHIDHRTQKLLLQFFDTASNSRGGNFGSWVQAFLPFAAFNIENSTPLYYASRFGLNSVVKVILAVQGTKSLEVQGGRRGSTPLHVASALGNAEVVKTLIAAGANAKEVNEKGECGLEWAVKYGSVEVVQLLLAAGADPDFRNRTGRTVLFYAVRLGQGDCATALLKVGAKSSDLDESGLTVSMLAEAMEN